MIFLGRGYDLSQLSRQSWRVFTLSIFENLDPNYAEESDEKAIEE